MPRISFHCSCGETIWAPEALAGKRAKCSKCGQIVLVPTRKKVLKPDKRVVVLTDEEIALVQKYGYEGLEEAASSFSKAERFQEAFQCTLILTKTHPDQAKFWRNCGMFLYLVDESVWRQGVPGLTPYRSAQKAIEYLAKATELDRNDHLAWYYEGFCLGQIGYFQEDKAMMKRGLKCFDQALRIRPGDPSTIQAKAKFEIAVATKLPMNDPNKILVVSVIAGLAGGVAAYFASAIWLKNIAAEDLEVLPATIAFGFPILGAIVGWVIGWNLSEETMLDYDDPTKHVIQGTIQATGIGCFSVFLVSGPVGGLLWLLGPLLGFTVAGVVLGAVFGALIVRYINRL